MGPLENRKVLRLKFDPRCLLQQLLSPDMLEERTNTSRGVSQVKEVDTKWQQLIQGSSLGDIAYAPALKFCFPSVNCLTDLE